MRSQMLLAIIYLTNQAHFANLEGMDEAPSTLTQLIDALEDLMIENTSLQSSVRVLEAFLPEAKARLLRWLRKQKTIPPFGHMFNPD